MTRLVILVTRLVSDGTTAVPSSSDGTTVPSPSDGTTTVSPTTSDPTGVSDVFGDEVSLLALQCTAVCCCVYYTNYA